MGRIKALTVQQPYATFLVSGHKKYETRSWRPRLRGRLAIHASKTFPLANRELCGQSPFREYLLDLGYHDWRELPTGAVLGIVTVEIVFVANQIAWKLSDEEKLLGDFSYDRYAWQITNPREFIDPVPAKGKLSLWQWSPIVAVTKDTFALQGELAWQ